MGATETSEFPTVSERHHFYLILGAIAAIGASLMTFWWFNT